MHGFLHIFLLKSETTEVVSEIESLSLDNIYFNADFIRILQDEGIDLTNRDTLVQVSEIQFKLEKVKFPLVYHFFSTQHFIFIVIATHLVKNLSKYVEYLLEEIEQEHEVFLEEEQKLEEQESENKNQPQKGETSHLSLKNHSIHDLQLENQTTKDFKFLQIIARNLAEYLLPTFLIPELRIEYSTQEPEILWKIRDFLTKICQENYKVDYSSKLFADLEGTWSIKEISEIYEIPITPLRELLFILWKTNIIILRMEYFQWDRFKTTIKAPLFLEEGSEENLSLIDKYNSNKIIRLIETIGNGCSYGYLVKNFEITRTKLNKYLSELEQRSIIQRDEYKPVLEFIHEDLIPLLSLQGFETADFKLLTKLAQILDGSVSIRSAALNLHVDPAVIKKLLDKYESAVKILT